MRLFHIIILSFLFFLSSPHLIKAQKEAKERILSDNRKLTFDISNNPVIQEESTPFFDPRINDVFQVPYPVPNSICDTTGKILMYSDGINIYNKNKEVMTNGNLRQYRLTSLNQNSVFIPIEENNRRYYYFLEVVPYEAYWDLANKEPLTTGLNFSYSDKCRLQYSIIDTKANNGLGIVINKNILIQDSVAPTISAVKHINNIDTWIVTHKTGTTEFYTFKINSCEIVPVDTANVSDFFYYIEPGFSLNYANFYSPFNLTFSTKGDFLCFPGFHKQDRSLQIGMDTKKFLFIVPFNNNTGIFDDANVDTCQYLLAEYGYYLFSHDSRYIYSFGKIRPIDVQGRHKILYVMDLQTHIAKHYYIHVDSNNYCHILDYGFNNDLFTIYNHHNSQSLDDNPYFTGKFLNIDQFDTPSFSFQGSLQTYNEETPKISNTSYWPYRNNHIMSFYHPSYQKPPATVSYEPQLTSIDSVFCHRDTLRLNVSTNVTPDSLVWNLTSTQSLSLKSYGTSFIQKLSHGNYTLTLNSYKYCLPEEIKRTFMVDPEPIAVLLKDTLYKCTSTISDLPPVQANAPYRWTNNASNEVTILLAEGFYTVTASNTCGNTSDTLNVSNTTIRIPNLITPNGDSKNEELQIESNNPEVKITLFVHNRWGDLVYQNINYHNNWQGENLSDGIYYYLIEYDGTCKNSGWIQIIR